MTKSETSVFAVIGASRGIGLEFVKQALEAGHALIAAARNPDKSEGLQQLKTQYPDALTLVSVDIVKPASVKAAAEEAAAAHPGGIDYLIHNAGVISAEGHDLDEDEGEITRVLQTNVAGAVATIKAFYPLLKKKEGGKKTVLAVSSLMGSVGFYAPGARDLAKPLGPYDDVLLGYKASKAALNQVIIQFANTLKNEGFTFIATHPGLVETDMSGGIFTFNRTRFGDDVIAQLTDMRITPQESVKAQLAILHSADQAKDNGRFYNYDGSELPF